MSGKSRWATAVATLAVLGYVDGVGAAGTSAPPPAAVDISAGDSHPLEEVTVRARRSALAPRVQTFVNQITALENAEGLPRWNNRKVCPLVSGLPRQEGEFILGRVSEIARGAGVPLDGPNCGPPDLYILVTPHPQELLQGMQKRNRPWTFGRYGDEFPAAVEKFISTPRAVRVWYISDEADEDGVPLWRSAHLADDASRLVSNVTWQLVRVFVIIDQKRLHAVSRGQLADYVAMTSLAQLKPDAPRSDAPTILKLFDGAPGSAPAGMSEWDQAFLKSLYASDQTSKLQRGQLARSMVESIVP